jgi:1,4-dihydroxy-2-naphthoate octaprenyltransferase
MLTQKTTRLLGCASSMATGCLIAALHEPWDWWPLVILLPSAIFYAFVVNNGVEPRGK